MRGRVSHGAIIGSIIKNDLRLYSRNKVYLLLTILSLAFFVLIFWVMPDTEEETITLAISPPLEKMIAEGREALLELGAGSEQLAQLGSPENMQVEEEGFLLVQLETPDQVQRAIRGEIEVYRFQDGSLSLRDPGAGEEKPAQARQVKLDLGIAFPDTFIGDVAREEKTTVTIFSQAAVPEELRFAMQGFVREAAYQLAGRELPVELPQEEKIILGPDRMGDQVPLQDKLRPMIAFFVLLMETFAMASLISTEVVQRTVTALLVTPMKVWHFLAAKTIFGTGLALTLGLAVLALVGAYTASNWLLVTATMLLGAALFTAAAMIIGAAGKDFVDQLMYGLLFTLPLMIPAVAVLFPGTAAVWVRFLPSYPLIDLLVGAIIYDAGWAQSWGALGYALLWVGIFYGIGLFVLKRKVESL